MSEKDFKELISQQLPDFIFQFENTLSKAERELLEKKINACNVLLTELPNLKIKYQCS